MVGGYKASNTIVLVESGLRSTVIINYNYTTCVELSGSHNELKAEIRYELPPLGRSSAPLSNRRIRRCGVDQRVRRRDVEYHRIRNGRVKARRMRRISRSLHTWQPLFHTGRELRYDGTHSTSLILAEVARTARTARRRAIRASVLVTVARVIEVARTACTARRRATRASVLATVASAVRRLATRRSVATRTSALQVVGLHVRPDGPNDTAVCEIVDEAAAVIERAIPVASKNDVGECGFTIVAHGHASHRRAAGLVVCPFDYDVDVGAVVGGLLGVADRVAGTKSWVGTYSIDDRGRVRL